ncbi:MAG: hypothetical protein ACFE9R_07285 [Candidatus Hermodarchaeota archaeon]
MIYPKDFNSEIDIKIDKIKKEIVSGKISLLELELNSLFNEMEGFINTVNLEQYAITYKRAYEILEQKFEELKKLLRSLDDDRKIIAFLKTNPKDEEIYEIFKGCWHKPYYVEDLSLEFLFYATNRYCKDNIPRSEIVHLKKIPSKEDFLIEVPELQFIEKLNKYYEEIIKKLPCVFDQIFDEEHNQIKIYEHFIYLLHLLQQGRIKYHKETNTLYL